MFRRNKTLDGILGKFHKVLHDLEAFAQRKEHEAEDFLDQHINLKKLEETARADAEKARTAIKNFGKLLGL